jgi:coenzyme PQQ precursor peptide PqqA
MACHAWGAERLLCRAGVRGCTCSHPRLSFDDPLVWAGTKKLEEIMAWTTPTLVEICIGLEINGYLPAEF